MKIAIVARSCAFCLLLCSAPRPGVAEGARPATPAPRASASARLEALLALESVRARRLVQRELRLRLQELRERDLERVRAVIEHRLGVETLLETETPAPGGRTHP